LELILVLETIIGEEVFCEIRDVLKNELPLNKLVCFVPDGASTMMGICNGLARRIK
jgi:hypothetical protein